MRRKILFVTKMHRAKRKIPYRKIFAEKRLWETKRKESPTRFFKNQQYKTLPGRLHATAKTESLPVAAT